MSKNKIKSFKRIVKPPSQSVILSLMALILIVGAPALIAMIDNEDSTHDLIVKSDISSYFDDGRFYGVWHEKPDDVTVSYDGLVDGNTVVITADYYDYSGSFDIGDLDVSLLTDLAKLELRSSEILNVGFRTSIILEDGYRIQSSISEDGVLTFSPSSVDLIKISNSEIFNIRITPTDPTSVIELEFTPYYQYTIPYGEIIIGATGVLLMVCAIFATPWFGIGGITAKPRRSK